MKSNVALFLFLISFLSVPVEAKKYPFKINTPREVFVCRSAKAGNKMVQVTTCGKNADQAIMQAMMDAVVSLSFWGASGLGEMEDCPAVLLEGLAAYDKNREFFDDFFRKGTFMMYVRKVNSTYPTGKDNVRTSKGRRIRILLIVDWYGLAEYYEKAGFKTIVGELSSY